ncbi:undecaprenyl-diphosphatase [Pelosinus fermentans]|uniref:Phosphoesterase PA-phosphatase related protein n=2 Tax=Sporomusaceae TaxID=1843490 RepID=I9LGY2_9FIRM|nr:phosphatase PAP2 family protein [Pelosinus fermentans]EIW19759.1 phosphoesterase PA-phosphatase related protein [Pelosinus fermentans B4]EIW21384.1 phosphoesterase PA-phosphatase related protein [Pelosinus fermentans A11]OAM94912.1 phosphoesterase PA-phosphatase related protein [Pelosinus fermentans DSM 17108]SDR20214.1 undecaprenyl-diphosphatase [Pelosinus fermentans]
MQGKALVLVLLLIFLLSIQVLVTANHGRDDEPPSLFSHKDIQLEPHHHIERLLVSSANAVVAGRIMEGAIIVDGNLTVLPGAEIQGKIIILGGQLNNYSGNDFEQAPWVVSPAKSPFTRIVLGGLMLLFVVSLILIPYLLWLIFHFASRFPTFLRIKDRLLEIRNRWPFFYIAITLVVSASMLILFGVLAWKTIFRQATGIFDSAFIWLIRYFASFELDRIMITITNLGFGFSYGVIVFITVSILVALRRWIELKGLTVCLLGGAALNEMLKHLFERARPEAFQIVAESGFSFPSGHAMVSLCFYGIVAFLIVRKRSLQWRIAGAVVATLLIVAIGVSRIYLGVHYPSDVVAGYAAGATWLGFSISLVMWWEQELSERDK